MKRFEFRLEQVLKLKRQQEQLAELRQQQARLRVETCQAAVNALHGQIHERAVALENGICYAADSEKETVPFAAGQPLLIAHYAQTRLLGQALTAAEKQLEQAQQELKDADRQRQVIATEVEALLSLRQQQWQAYRQELARAQQEQLDELGLQRWLAGQQVRSRGAGKGV